MIDAKKLNNTIEELENEVENIKSISTLVKKVDTLSNDILMNNEAYEVVINDIKLIKGEISEISKGNEVFLVNTKKQLEDINNTIDKRIIEIQNENIILNKELTKTYNQMEENLLAQLQNVRNETKKLYLEIDELLITRLDRNKSDIQVEIRNNKDDISTQIKNEVTRNVDKMNANMETNNQIMDDKMKKQNILLMVLIAIGIISMILRFIKF